MNASTPRSVLQGALRLGQPGFATGSAGAGTALVGHITGTPIATLAGAVIMVLSILWTVYRQWPHRRDAALGRRLVKQMANHPDNTAQDRLSVLCEHNRATEARARAFRPPR